MAARYSLTGNLALVFMPSDVPIHNLQLITSADIGHESAVDLIGPLDGEGLAGVQGWEASSSSISVPDYRSRSSSSIRGRTKFDASSLDFFAHKSVHPIRTALQPGVSGLFVWMFTGASWGQRYEAFPGVVQSAGRMKGNNEANKFRASIAIGVPVEGMLAPDASSWFDAKDLT